MQPILKANTPVSVDKSIAYCVKLRWAPLEKDTIATCFLKHWQAKASEQANAILDDETGEMLECWNIGMLEC